jgi:hypothetical protein
MGRRNIRLRPVRRKEIDMRRLAVAVTLLAAHKQQQSNGAAGPNGKPTTPTRTSGGGDS